MANLPKSSSVRLQNKWLWVWICYIRLNFRYRSKGLFDIQVTTKCRFTLNCICLRTQSHLVILAIVLSLCTCIPFMSTFLSRGTFLMTTEFHAPHTTWNGLITNHLVDWCWDATLVFCNLEKAFTHITTYSNFFTFQMPSKQERFIIVTVWWSLGSESQLYGIER